MNNLDNFKTGRKKNCMIKNHEIDLMVNSTTSLINSTWERKAEASTTKELALF